MATAIPEHRVSTWTELNDALYSNSFDDRIQRFRSPFAFRGMSRNDSDLRTSLVRLGGDFSQIEGHLLRNFRKYAHREAVAIDSIWNWLAVAQHHGLPTRLLDWTFSPYIAMHFATESHAGMAEDGVIWCVDFVRLKEYLPKKLRQELEREGSDVFTVEMLQEMAESLSDLQELAKEDFAVFLEPPSLDPRIIVQSALFSLMSSPEACLHDWLEKHGGLAHKVIIPADLKWEVRDKLDQANINERIIFPGLDGLSRWLKRYYSAKGK